MTVVDAWVLGPSTRVDEACLAAPERGEAARATTAARRARHRRSRAALRHALAAVLGAAPATVALDAPAGVRPVVLPGPGGPGPAVSLAHAAGHVAVAVCRRGPVGIDLEVPAARRRPVPQRVLTDDRLAAVVGLVGDDVAPTGVWVVLEAALKAAGTGFAFPLDHVRLHPTGAGVGVAVGSVLDCAVTLRVLPGGVVTAVAAPPGSDVAWHDELLPTPAPGPRRAGAPSVLSA